MNFITKLFASKEKPKEEPKKEKKKAPKVKAEIIGDLGEYKINIQLDQFPANHKYLSDLMLENNRSRSEFSQVDHILLTPYGIFVIETKNYTGEIMGAKSDKQWTVNKKHKMMNPFHQNYGHVQTIRTILQLPYTNSIYSLISFTKRAIFRVDPELRKIQSNNLCVYDVELTEFINRKIHITKLTNSTPIFTDEQIETMFQALLNANIENKQIREQHVNNIKNSINNNCLTCSTCGKKVSEKVKNFCLTSQKFQGKIYCYECQNTKTPNKK